MTYKNTKQRGFTLIELLVVIGIIAALAAVVIPNVAKFMGAGDTAANEAELQAVQSAVDALMSDTTGTLVPLSVVTAGGPVGSTAGEWASTDFDPDGTNTRYLSDYLRQDPTKCDYSWTAAGLVSQGTCS